jgi:hypothetical protein
MQIMVTEIFPEAFDMDACHENQHKQNESEVQPEQGHGHGNAWNQAHVGGQFGKTQCGHRNVLCGQGQGCWSGKRNDHDNGQGAPS